MMFQIDEFKVGNGDEVRNIKTGENERVLEIQRNVLKTILRVDENILLSVYIGKDYELSKQNLITPGMPIYSPLDLELRGVKI